MLTKNSARRLISKFISKKKKKKAYFEEKLKENTASPKELWKTLEQLGPPEKRLPCIDVCLKAKEEAKFDTFTIPELFRKFYSNLSNGLVQKFTAATKKIDIGLQKTIIKICLN